MVKNNATNDNSKRRQTRKTPHEYSYAQNTSKLENQLRENHVLIFDFGGE